MQASALGTPSPPPSRLCSLHATGPAPRHVAITPGATTTTGRANEACGGTRRCASSMTSKVMSEMKSRALRPRSACRITNHKHSPGFVSTLFLFLFLFLCVCDVIFSLITVFSGSVVRAFPPRRSETASRAPHRRRGRVYHQNKLRFVMCTLNRVNDFAASVMRATFAPGIPRRRS